MGGHVGPQLSVGDDRGIDDHLVDRSEVRLEQLELLASLLGLAGQECGDVALVRFHVCLWHVVGKREQRRDRFGAVGCDGQLTIDVRHGQRVAAGAAGTSPSSPPLLPDRCHVRLAAVATARRSSAQDRSPAPAPRR